MNRLQRIMDHKRAEVAMRRCERPAALLREAIGLQEDQAMAPRSLRAALAARAERGPFPAVLAEFKRRSPSAGAIAGAELAEAEDGLLAVAKGYEAAGAAAMSVLTDEVFFGGSAADLIAARSAVALPLLRKDFMLDPYQLLEARLWGADAVLLIAECLSAGELGALFEQAQALGLEVLVEVHDLASLPKLPAELPLLGINHRDLRDFSVDLARGPERLPALRKACPHALYLAESGINSAEDAQRLLRAGFDALLIGSLFMRQPDPAGALRDFLRACTENGHFSTEQMFNS
jgi:indole-3-glycerol phosphate synthase